MNITTVSVFAENSAGSLARITNLLASKGYEIVSITSGATKDPTILYLTIALKNHRSNQDLILKHLNRCIDVIKVSKVHKNTSVEREMILARLEIKNTAASSLQMLFHSFSAKCEAAESSTQVIVELSDTTEKIDAFVALLKQFTVVDLVRSGKIAFAR